MTFFKTVKVIVTASLLTIFFGAVSYYFIWYNPLIHKPVLEDYFVPGLIVMGFYKDYYPQDEVYRIMNDFDFEYTETRNVNAGADFIDKAGNVFLVRVPEGKEAEWVKDLNSFPFIYAAGRYVDPDLLIVE